MKKIINSQFKREVENLIQAKLRIITRETDFHKALEPVPHIRGQSRVIYVFETNGYTLNDTFTVYTIQICPY